MATGGKRADIADTGQEECVDGSPPCCYESAADTLVVGVVSDSPQNVVVWDELETICGPGHLFVHLVYGQRSRPMAVGAGEAEHYYKACFFDDPLPVNGTGCQPFAGAARCRRDYPIRAWRVLPEGETCPPIPEIASHMERIAPSSRAPHAASGGDGTVADATVLQPT